MVFCDPSTGKILSLKNLHTKYVKKRLKIVQKCQKLHKKGKQKLQNRLKKKKKKKSNAVKN